MVDVHALTPEDGRMFSFRSNAFKRNDFPVPVFPTTDKRCLLFVNIITINFEFLNYVPATAIVVFGKF